MSHTNIIVLHIVVLTLYSAKGTSYEAPYYAVFSICSTLFTYTLTLRCSLIGQQIPLSYQIAKYVGFEIFMAVTMKMTASVV
jgi:hypothetical protein